MESEILSSNEEVKVVPNKISEEIKELGDMTETKRTSKLNDTNKDITECNLLEETNSNKLKTKSWEQLKFNGVENIQNLQFSSQGQLTYHKFHLAASDSLLNQTVQESTNQKEIKHSLSASNLNINVANIPTKLHKDNKSINLSLNNSEHHSFANDFNIAETFDDNQLERISLKTSLCHQENVGVHNKQTQKYSCNPSENSSFDKLGNDNLIEKNAMNSDKAIISSEIDFIIQDKHNNENESKQDSIHNQADSVNILKERSSDGISMCSSQSRESEDESDALLSELECELESGNEEISGVSCTQLNGIKANLLHQSKYTKSLMQKFKNHPRSPSFYNTSKQAIEYFELQIDFLERANSQLQKELKEVNEKHSDEKNEIKKQLIQVKSDLGEKIEKLQKQYEGAQKERDNMVLRYAQSERDVINLKKVRDEFEKKLKDAAKEREGILNRIKGLNTEKSRLCNSLDSKSSEISALRRESERLREEVNSRDIRIKWTQNKLKTEMDAHKETQTKLEHTLLRLQQTREEAEQVRKDCQEMIRCYQEAEEIKSVNLDHQLREKLSELEVQKQERSDQEEVYQMVRHELEALKKKHKVTIEENNQLTVKINILEKERLDHEQIVSKLKEQQSILRQEVVDLSGRLAEMENLKIQLEREKERVLNSQKEVERFCQVNAELQCDMEACRNKEGELLEFTERLTAKSVALQSEYSLLETKAQTLEDEMNRINKKCTELENQNIELIDQLEEERKQRKEETQLLARKLAEKTKTVEDLTVKLEDAVNENKVTKRRHITSIKELSRELLQAKRRLENYEINHTTGDSVSLGSRTSSTGSLDILTNNNVAKISNDQNATSHTAPAVTFSGGKIPSSHSSQTKTSETKVNNQNASLSNNSPLSEVNKQMLIERIVKLQRSLARKNEKIEFQEEHINHLIDEIKKKTRIIQSYIIREEAGALATNTMDQNKLSKGKWTKAVVAKKGGVMASVYRSHVADSHMSLELSLEINNKLQAVLEDTILKNITLKENINTLGEEIARVVKEHRTLQTQLAKYKSGK
ncbi:coiled-coil domain-containing protein 186 isoform X1 [Centruroides vittatus]|uniref:coiled-coil domain-containing protein 186 isoform X1 n=1 Tax=Centruroides vittatus TaxID=120091 RepID=UPI00350F41E0